MEIGTVGSLETSWIPYTQIPPKEGHHPFSETLPRCTAAPTGSMDVCRECCVLLRRSLCDDQIARPEKSYRLCGVVVCKLETW
jgi:hypothetical protein